VKRNTVQGFCLGVSIATGLCFFSAFALGDTTLAGVYCVVSLASAIVALAL